MSVYPLETAYAVAARWRKGRVSLIVTFVQLTPIMRPARATPTLTLALSLKRPLHNPSAPPRSTLTLAHSPCRERGRTPYAYPTTSCATLCAPSRRAGPSPWPSPSRDLCITRPPRPGVPSPWPSPLLGRGDQTGMFPRSKRVPQAARYEWTAHALRSSMVPLRVGTAHSRAFSETPMLEVEGTHEERLSHRRYATRG